ncbi:MAG: hypothetical protein RLY14_676 [Planctomycetota bacterium]|jgi:hypothetical protein
MPSSNYLTRKTRTTVCNSLKTFSLVAFVWCVFAVGGFSQDRAALPDPGEPPAPPTELDIVDVFLGLNKKPMVGKADGNIKGELKDMNVQNIQIQAAQPIVVQAVPMIGLAPAVRVEVAVVAQADAAADVEKVEAMDKEKGNGEAPGENADEEVLDSTSAALSRTFKVEVALLRRACKFSVEQEKQIETWNSKWLVEKLKTPAGKKAIASLKIGELQQNFNASIPNHTLRRKALHSMLIDELKVLLTPEQLTSYEDEVKSREDFERAANVDALVAIIDNNAFLTDAQRESVKKEVSSQKNLPADPINYLRYGNYIPHFSLASISKHLTSFQRKLLQGLQQVQFGVSVDEDPEVIER